MAGAGFKTFNTGDVLLASEVNTYLMQQTVMVFDDATARTAALGANVAEGMFSYLKDTNLTYRYDGSAWLSDAGTTSPLTTKGDLWSYSTTDARLAVGNNGETLVADSSATVGLRYSATPSASNPVLNSAFQIWQRGTSTAGAVSYSNYVADRWVGYNGSAGSVASTWSRQTTNDTTNLPNIQYCIRAQRNSGNTGTGALELVQAFESVNSIPYAGKTITFSFYARKGANFSASSDILVARLFSGTGTDQNPGTMSATNIVNQNTTLTTTWQRFSYTGTVATTATQLCIQMYYTPTGTAGAADFFEATGFQIDIGSVALPFRTQNNTLAGELAACQRYFYMHASGANKTIALGAAYTSGEVDAYVPFKVNMRTAPTLVASSGTNYYNFNRNSATDAFNSWIIYNAHETGCQIYNNTEISSTAGQAGIVENGNASASVAFSAEL